MIQVTTLYEDLEAGLRAKALMECVQSCMDTPVEFKLGLWRFDWLKERSLANIALSATKRSELVIVSTTTAITLPGEMERWLHAWGQGREDHPSALMALLSHARYGSSACGHPLRDCLQSAAQRKGVDFFCEYYDPTIVTDRSFGEDHETPANGRIQWEFNPAPLESLGRNGHRFSTAMLHESRMAGHSA
jgi:hypothetical protein